MRSKIVFRETFIGYLTVTVSMLLFKKIIVILTSLIFLYFLIKKFMQLNTKKKLNVTMTETWSELSEFFYLLFSLVFFL